MNTEHVFVTHLSYSNLQSHCDLYSEIEHSERLLSPPSFVPQLLTEKSVQQLVRSTAAIAMNNQSFGESKKHAIKRIQLPRREWPGNTNGVPLTSKLNSVFGSSLSQGLWILKRRCFSMKLQPGSQSSCLDRCTTLTILLCSACHLSPCYPEDWHNFELILDSAVAAFGR